MLSNPMRDIAIGLIFLYLLLSVIVTVSYPIGWTGWDDVSPTGQPDQQRGWAIIGILITGLAMSLGASFWFDLLGKFMNVRMTGKTEPTATLEATSAGSK